MCISEAVVLRPLPTLVDIGVGCVATCTGRDALDIHAEVGSCTAQSGVTYRWFGSSDRGCSSPLPVLPDIGVSCVVGDDTEVVTNTGDIGKRISRTQRLRSDPPSVLPDIRISAIVDCRTEACAST